MSCFFFFFFASSPASRVERATRPNSLLGVGRRTEGAVGGASPSRSPLVSTPISTAPSPSPRPRRSSSSSSSSFALFFFSSLRIFCRRAKSRPLTRCVCSTSPPRNFVSSAVSVTAAAVVAAPGAPEPEPTAAAAAAAAEGRNMGPGGAGVAPAADAAAAAAAPNTPSSMPS